MDDPRIDVRVYDLDFLDESQLKRPEQRRSAMGRAWRRHALS